MIEQLSEFQRNVRLALYEWKGSVIPDDAEAFDDFCRQWPIEHEETANDRTRRALEQLAALGLVAKVSLRNDSGEFITSFRPLREDENTRLMDAEHITSLLTKRGAGEGGAQH
jgi:type I restriction enzyme S subunit